MDLDVIGLIAQASLVVKLVLLFLAAMSVGSWWVIVTRWLELRRAKQDSEAFLEVYHEDPFAAVFEAARELDHSPLSALFLAGCKELRALARGGRREGLSAEEAVRVRKRLVWTAARERSRLERGLPFLATTGSSSPFIGLFGTVIGIIGAFEGIGRSGSASLAVVAPGIAEALIATAVGLFAAIPATVFYNSFVTRVEDLDDSIEIFRGEFEDDLDELAAHASGAGKRG